MLVTVARARAADPLDLIHAPLWRVLWHYLHLEELDARRALARRHERVDAGLMTARAFNAPATLGDELEAVHKAIAEADADPVDEALAYDDWRARGAALAAKIDAGRVLSPEALIQ